MKILHYIPCFMCFHCFLHGFHYKSVATGGRLGETYHVELRLHLSLMWVISRLFTCEMRRGFQTGVVGCEFVSRLSAAVVIKLLCNLLLYDAEHVISCGLCRLPVILSVPRPRSRRHQKCCRFVLMEFQMLESEQLTELRWDSQSHGVGE